MSVKRKLKMSSNRQIVGLLGNRGCRQFNGRWCQNYFERKLGNSGFYGCAV